MLVCSPVVISQPLGAAQPKKLRLAFSAFAYANPPFWIVHELKLFEKYGGYETELVYVGGSRPIQAMLGGSIEVSQVGGGAAVEAQRTVGQLLKQNLPLSLESVCASCSTTTRSASPVYSIKIPPTSSICGSFANSKKMASSKNLPANRKNKTCALPMHWSIFSEPKG